MLIWFWDKLLLLRQKMGLSIYFVREMQNSSVCIAFRCTHVLFTILFFDYLLFRSKIEYIDPLNSSLKNNELKQTKTCFLWCMWRESRYHKEKKQPQKLFLTKKTFFFSLMNYNIALNSLLELKKKYFFVIFTNLEA